MNTRAVKYFGASIALIALWSVSGFVHEGQMINACEKGKHQALSHNTYTLQGCKLIKK
jgi:hypothetical protein